VAWSFTYNAPPVAAGLHFKGFLGKYNKSLWFRTALRVQKSLNHMNSKLKIQTPQKIMPNNVSRTVATGVFYNMICATWRADEKQ